MIKKRNLLARILRVPVTAVRHYRLCRNLLASMRLAVLLLK
jgi:hypothetical protein